MEIRPHLTEKRFVQPAELQPSPSMVSESLQQQQRTGLERRRLGRVERSVESDCRVFAENANISKIDQEDVGSSTNLVECKIWPMPGWKQNRNMRAISIIAVPRYWLDVIEGCEGTTVDSWRPRQQMKLKCSDWQTCNLVPR